MTKKSDATEKRGMHGQQDVDSDELRKKVEQMHAAAAGRDEGGRASVSDAESGEEGIRDKGLDADASDDAIDRITRRSPPLSDDGSRRE